MHKYTINTYSNNEEIGLFRCNLRFPSTNIRLYFQSLVEDPDDIDDLEDASTTNSTMNGGKTNNSQVTGLSDMKPLNINIPQPGSFSSNNSSSTNQLKLIPNHHNHSPPSPTGTIRLGLILIHLYLTNFLIIYI